MTKVSTSKSSRLAGTTTSGQDTLVVRFIIVKNKHKIVNVPVKETKQSVRIDEELVDKMV